jgi:hypothetical protein
MELVGIEPLHTTKFLSDAQGQEIKLGLRPMPSAGLTPVSPCEVAAITMMR